MIDDESTNNMNSHTSNSCDSEKLHQSFNRLQSSENFDEHISTNCVEFDDTASGFFLFEYVN